MTPEDCAGRRAPHDAGRCLVRFVSISVHGAGVECRFAHEYRV